MKQAEAGMKQAEAGRSRQESRIFKAFLASLARE